MTEKVSTQMRFPVQLKERIRTHTGQLTKVQGGVRYPMSTFIATACEEKLQRDVKVKRVKKVKRHG